MKKPNFPLMGKIVTVLEKYERYQTHDYSLKEEKTITKRKWRRVPIKPRAGWVTGYRFIYEGIYYPSTCDYLESYNPAYLDVTKTIKCLLVSFFPTYNPIRVPVDSIIKGGTPKNTSLPWTDLQRITLSKETKNWPRDKKGRWKKCKPIM